jgi:23S rRNA (uridine2552-2'-O)-methyltransferase
VLAPGGSFVCKIFQGEDFEAFAAEVKAAFERCKMFKPRSTRKESRETYAVAAGRK